MHVISSSPHCQPVRSIPVWKHDSQDAPQQTQLCAGDNYFTVIKMSYRQREAAAKHDSALSLLSVRDHLLSEESACQERDSPALATPHSPPGRPVKGEC